MEPISIDKLEWSAKLEVGVPEIDEQHMILVHTLREANQTLQHRFDVESVRRIVQDLLSYALYHFETEEELMQQYDYFGDDESAANAHLAQHRAFSQKVVEVRKALDNEILIEREVLMDFLANWLVGHVQQTDRKLGEFICARRQKVT